MTSMTMTETRNAELKQMLDARRRALQRDFAVKLRGVRANNGYQGEVRGGLDTAETSDANLQQDIGIALIEMRVEMLRRVQDALARLEEGTYGLCAGCGREISEQRLRAVPFAVRCRACEERSEISARRARQLVETRPGSPRLAYHGLAPD